MCLPLLAVPLEEIQLCGRSNLMKSATDCTTFPEYNKYQHPISNCATYVFAACLLPTVSQVTVWSLW